MERPGSIPGRFLFKRSPAHGATARRRRLPAPLSDVRKPLMFVSKKIFELPELTTIGGDRIRDVKVGWESYGELNADKSNAILICHYFRGTSHAAGKYRESDAAPGYWDAIVGAGKAVDTDKYFVFSSDTLINVNANDPMVTTTGPASIDPATGKPYGLSFPLLEIGDFVRVQKALVDHIGIKKL